MPCRRTFRSLGLGAGLLLLLVGALQSSFGAGLPVVRPLTNHPGNIFLAEEPVGVALPGGPATQGGAWRLFDYAGAAIASGTATNGRALLGELPVGYYELRRTSNGVPVEPRVPMAVLAPLRTLPPASSPIGLDVSMAERCDESQFDAVVNLCRLAGVSWVRDRFSWRALEPMRGVLAPAGRYDAAVLKQAAAGLQVLQVFNDSPGWASPNPKRIPADLRDAARFMEAMARRWQGQVAAFEPWNEGDIPVFGGHSGMELASYQKACYFGLKAGNSNVIVCQNAFGSPHPLVLQDFNANQAGAYFDTFNFHHYASLEEYPALYAAFRGASAGKPLWATEFCVPIPWVNGTEPNKEATDADLRVQAERIPKLYAVTLHHRPAVAFYFMLLQYTEVQSLYGVLRSDLTPRPAFLSLAAVGRLLPDAKPLGRLAGAGPIRAFGFQARPEGELRDVLVAWSEGGEADLPLPFQILGVYDVVGRTRTNRSGSVKLTSSPQFLVCTAGTLSRLRLEPPPVDLAPPPTTAPCAIVLQSLIPKERLIDSLSAYTCAPGSTNVLPVFAYNFGRERISGNLSVEVPSGWRAQLPERLDLAPGDRVELPLTLVCGQGCLAPAETVTVRGDFGPAGKSVLALRLTLEPFRVAPGPVVKIAGAVATNRWQAVAPPSSRVVFSPGEGEELKVEAGFASAERWVYPVLDLAANERAPTNAVALALTLKSIEGRGQFRILFQEENQSIRFADFFPQPQPGEMVETLAVLTNALFGEGWSPPDDNGKLDFEKISRLRIGCNTTNDKAIYSIRNVRWLLGNGR